MKLLKLKIQPNFALALTVASYSLFLYSCQLMVYEGIRADVTHTSGDLTLGDIFLLLTSLVLLPLGTYLLLKSFRWKSSVDTTKRTSLQLKGLLLIALLFTVASIIASWLAYAPIFLGIIAILLSLNDESKELKSIVTYRIANVFATLISILSIVLTAYYHY